MTSSGQLRVPWLSYTVRGDCVVSSAARRRSVSVGWESKSSAMGAGIDGFSSTVNTDGTMACLGNLRKINSKLQTDRNV